MSWIMVEIWLLGATVVGIALLVLAHLTERIRGAEARDTGDPVLMRQDISFPSRSLNS
jgi:hypothetical protein